MHLWKKYDGRRIEFEYDPIGKFHAGAPRKDDGAGLFFMVDVFSPELIDIRKEFGFKSDWKLHLTFGRTYSAQ